MPDVDVPTLDATDEALRIERDRALAMAARCAERCRQMEEIVEAARGLNGVRVRAYADGERALYRLRDALAAYQPHHEPE